MTTRPRTTCPKCGEPCLTARQDEVLALVAQGRETREIATELDLAIETVRWYIKMLLGEFGVHNRVQLANRARERGLIS